VDALLSIPAKTETADDDDNAPIEPQPEDEIRGGKRWNIIFNPAHVAEENGTCVGRKHVD
jgi:hypothetical protein